MPNGTRSRRRGRRWRPPGQWLTGILETIGDAVITIDDDHRIIFFNKEASRIFGYPPEAILGGSLSVLLPEPDRDAHAHQIEQFAHGPQTSRLMGARSEIRGRRSNGTIFWAEASISRMTTPTGTLFTAVLRDVTERREADRELRDAFIAISEATAAKSRFFHSVSHELRTPLNAMLGMSDVMAQELLGEHSQPRYREYSRDIHRSGVHLLDLIEELIDYATAECDGMVLHEECVDLDLLYGACLQAKAKLLAAAQVRTAREGLRGRVLWADPLRMQELVANLLLHARRASPAGGEIVLGVSDTEDGGLVLSVTDSGPGMTEEQVAYAFEPTRRAAPDFAGGGETGLGLGLPIARRLANLHGATIEIHNTADGGARVNVIFPAERVRNALQLASLPSPR